MAAGDTRLVVADILRVAERRLRAVVVVAGDRLRVEHPLRVVVVGDRLRVEVDMVRRPVERLPLVVEVVVGASLPPGGAPGMGPPGMGAYAPPGGGGGYGPPPGSMGGGMGMAGQRVAFNGDGGKLFVLTLLYRAAPVLGGYVLILILALVGRAIDAAVGAGGILAILMAVVGGLGMFVVVLGSAVVYTNKFYQFYYEALTLDGQQCQYTGTPQEVAKLVIINAILTGITLWYLHPVGHCKKHRIRAQQSARQWSAESAHVPWRSCVAAWHVHPRKHSHGHMLHLRALVRE